MSLDDLNVEAQQDNPTNSTAKPETKEQEPRPSWETHPQNPFNWSTKKKYRQFLVGSLVTLLVGINSTVIATPGTTIARHFNVDTSNANIDNTVWPIAAWNTGAAFGPMIGIPLLEAFGMRNGYFVRDALLTFENLANSFTRRQFMLFSFSL